MDFFLCEEVQFFNILVYIACRASPLPHSNLVLLQSIAVAPGIMTGTRLDHPARKIHVEFKLGVKGLPFCIQETLQSGCLDDPLHASIIDQSVVQ
jgi:hypothetical protein